MFYEIFDAHACQCDSYDENCSIKRFNGGG